MTRSGSPRIVLLGMMTKMPVPGVVWQTLQYMLGFERLGYETYYVEAHGRTPSMFMVEEEDAAPRASAFLADVLGRYGFGRRWAFHALHSDARCYGMELPELVKLYRSAALIVNLHGGTMPLQEHLDTGRLVLLETDPVTTQIELYEGNETTAEFLRGHAALFTFAESYGSSWCGLPRSEDFEFIPTRQPVVMNLWQGPPDPGERFTTVANWCQQWRTVSLDGEQYLWSKHHEFLRFLDLPALTGQRFELALSGCNDDDRARLRQNGWMVSSALELTLDGYRSFLSRSKAEFTVAKDQNVRLRTGWFSDRSAAYLASGRAVITQETGFSHHLPTGLGLFAYNGIDELVDAVQRVVAEPRRHALAARDLAAEHFAHDRVLPPLLDTVGLRGPAATTIPRTDISPPLPAGGTPSPFPADLSLEPVRRNPTVLNSSTVAAVSRRPVVAGRVRDRVAPPNASIVVLTHDNMILTRLCLETLLAQPDTDRAEVIVVDNGSVDGTVSWLEQLTAVDPRVSVVVNAQNLGFAPGVNQGLDRATGSVVVLLNNDTIPTPGWLSALARHLSHDKVGMVAPMTGRGGGGCNVPVTYRTYGEMLLEAQRMVTGRSGHWRAVDTLPMFCVALRRETYQSVGPLDEAYEVGLFEDEDYCQRLCAAGYELRCAEDAFVHHFGRATLDRLVPGGEYARLFDANRLRFEQKWGRTWRPPQANSTDSYASLVERLHHLVDTAVPDDRGVAILSRGDEAMVELGRGRRALHFPAGPDGIYAGHYPANGAEAVRLLVAASKGGAAYLVVPITAAWWLRHYEGFAEHLEHCATVVADKEDTGTIYRLAVDGRRPFRSAHS